MSKSQSKMTAGLFTLIAAVALAAVLYMVLGSSGADTVGQSASVANATPTVDSVAVAIETNASGTAVADANVNMADGSDTTIYIYGVASDDNGCDDINTLSNWSGVVYHTGATGDASCSADSNDCYTVDTTNDATLLTSVNDCTGTSDADLAFEFTVDLAYYSDPTDSGAHSAENWVASITAQDDSSQDSSAADTTFEVVGGNALALSGGPVAYGEIALGANSDGTDSITISNTGNQAIDVNISMPDMNCTGLNGTDESGGGDDSTLAATNLEYSLTSGFSHGAGTDVTNGGANFDMTLPQRTGAAVSEALYFALGLPSDGIAGTCSETMTITAIDAL